MTNRDLKPENMPIVGWARLLTVALKPYCAVIAVTDSVLTSCRGRWSKAEPTHYIAGGPLREVDDDGVTFAKCGTCEANARALPVDVPVDGPVNHRPVSPMTAPDWDLSDIGGEG